MLTPMFNDTDTLSTDALSTGPLSTNPLSTNMVNSTWATEAACRTGDATNIALFFSEDLHDIAAAKRICAGCPALAPCLEGALEREEPAGVWGGQLFLNGRVLTVKRRRGRPPKVPRPEEQLPDVPVPEHLRGLLRTA